MIKLFKGSVILICPNCKAEIPDGSKFCGRCGTAIAQAQSQPVSFEDDNRTMDASQVEAAVNAQPSVQEVEPQAESVAAEYQPVNNAQNFGYQPADGGAQPYAYQGDTAVAVAPKKSKKPLMIILIAGGAVLLVAAVMLVLIFGFKIFDKSKGSPQDAYNEMISMFNDGKYEEAIRKYSFDDGASLNGTDISQYQGLLSSIKWNVQIFEVKTYKRGDYDFDSELRNVTTDSRYTGGVTEVAVMKVKLGYSAFGKSNSNETTVYMGRYNGAWKLSNSSSLFYNSVNNKDEGLYNKSWGNEYPTLNQ